MKIKHAQKSPSPRKLAELTIEQALRVVALVDHLLEQRRKSRSFLIPKVVDGKLYLYDFNRDRTEADVYDLGGKKVGTWPEGPDAASTRCRKNRKAG